MFAVTVGDECYGHAERSEGSRMTKSRLFASAQSDNVAQNDK
jgi:hypothetical protein